MARKKKTIRKVLVGLKKALEDYEDFLSRLNSPGCPLCRNRGYTCKADKFYAHVVRALDDLDTIPTKKARK